MQEASMVRVLLTDADAIAHVHADDASRIGHLQVRCMLIIPCANDTTPSHTSSRASANVIFSLAISCPGMACCSLVFWGEQQDRHAGIGDNQQACIL